MIGTSERPRLCVYKSLKHIYAQLVDERVCRPLSTVSSRSTQMRSKIQKEDNKSAISRKVGVFLAEKAKELGITKVAFDRNKYPYHGRVGKLKKNFDIFEVLERQIQVIKNQDPTILNDQELQLIIKSVKEYIKRYESLFKNLKNFSINHSDPCLTNILFTKELNE